MMVPSPLEGLEWDRQLRIAKHMTDLHKADSASQSLNETPPKTLTAKHKLDTCKVKKRRREKEDGIAPIVTPIPPRYQRAEIDPPTQSCSNLLNSLMDGEDAHHFKTNSDGDIFAVIGEQEVNVLLSDVLDLDDVANFCPLMDWQSIDTLLAVDEEANQKENSDVPKSGDTQQVVKLSQATKQQMKDALAYAKETKLFPPNILLKSEFHIEFLFNHFCRESRPAMRNTKLKKRWKEVIRKNLDVLDDSIGCMGCGPYSFSLLPGSKPVRCKSYPLSPVKKDALTKMLKVLLENDIIEESTSAEWNSPLLLVSKGDGRWRLVVDYRRVNMLIENAAVVYPRPDDLFETVRDAYFMFLIDGRDFYFQREIDPAMRPVTTFQTHILAYQWKRMPQGLKPSSAAAINPVTKLLQEALHEWSLLHCDDFLGWAKNEELSIKRFDWVLTKFRTFGMTLGWFKIWILLDRAEYVSHVIDKGKVYPSPKMVTAIHAIQPPTTVKLVQTFVGMCGYFALYVPMMAEYRAKLTGLTKDGVVWNDKTWTKEHQEAFDQIKNLLKAACVYIVDWDKPMTLVTDASGSALGGCLMQKIDGYFRPLRFMSRSLDKFEKMQENREREMRAGLYCMLKCNSMLANNLFTWVTDHANIKFVMTAKSENQRIARLALWLSSYWYHIQHSAGDSALMKIADAMSRLVMTVSNEDGLIFVPFDDATVQNILLSTISEEIITSPARFSNNTDTYAKLTRCTAEIIPHSLESKDQTIMAAIQYENSITLQESAATSYLLTCSELASHEENYCAVDLFTSFGTSTSALESNGYVVVAMVESNEVCHFQLESVTDGVIYSSASRLADAISKNQIKLPKIQLVNCNIAQPLPRSQYHTHSSEIMAPQGETQVSPLNHVSLTLRLVQALNGTQSDWQDRVAIVTFMCHDRSHWRAVRREEDAISGMGYSLHASTIVNTASHGCTLSAMITVVTMTLRSNPSLQTIVYQPHDDSPPVSSILDPRKNSSSTLLAQGPKQWYRSHRNTLHASRSNPIKLVESKRTAYYSADRPVPCKLFPILPAIVINPTEHYRGWRGRLLTIEEVMRAYGLQETLQQILTKIYSRNGIPSILSTLTPAAPLTSIFSTTMAKLKVGGVRGERSDTVTTVLKSLIENGTRVDPGLRAELVLQSCVRQQTWTTARSKSRKQSPDKLNALIPHNKAESLKVMYEVFNSHSDLAAHFRSKGWKVITLDLHARTTHHAPTEVLDISNISIEDVKRLFKKHGIPDYMHFTPPSDARSPKHLVNTHFVKQSGKHLPRTPEAKMCDECVCKSVLMLQMAQELNSKVKFTIENPVTASFKRCHDLIKLLIAQGKYATINYRNYQHSNKKDTFSYWILGLDSWKPKAAKDKGIVSTVRQNKTRGYPQKLIDELYEAVETDARVIKPIAHNKRNRTLLEMRSEEGRVKRTKHLSSQFEKSQVSERRVRFLDAQQVGISLSAMSTKSGKGPNRAAEHDLTSEEESESDAEAESNSSSDDEGNLVDSEGRILSDANDYYVGIEEIKEVQAADVQLKAFAIIARINTAIDDAGPDEISKLQLERKTELQRSLKTKTERGLAIHMYIDGHGVMVFGMANKHWPVPVINSTLGLKKVIPAAHDNLTNVHIGQRKMTHWIRQRYWWMGMVQDVKKHTTTCYICQRMKFASSPGYGFHQMRVFDRPGRCICIDIVVLRHKSPKGTMNIFTILDTFSHYPDAYCIGEATAETCAQCLLQWCQYNGMPEEIRSDGGLNLNKSRVIEALYELCGISSTVTHPYAPQGNMVESWHRWLGSSLRTLYYERDLDVDESLPYVLWIFRGTENRVTGFTPFSIHLGREVRFPLDVFDSSVAHLTPHEYAAHVKETMQTLWKDVRIASELHQEESATYYNSKHGVIRDITQGSLVLRTKISQTPGDVSTHMLPKCSGPYQVLKVSAKGARIKHSVTGKELNTTLRQLRPLRQRPSDDSIDEQGNTSFSAGQLVVVRLKVPKNVKRKWQVAKLLHTTPDENAWEVQWYNSPDTGSSFLDMRYLPAYATTAGKEVYTKSPKTGMKPLCWNVYKHRFITPAFKLNKDKLPPKVRAAIRASSVSKKQD